MKFLLLFLFISSVWAEELSHCQKSENGSLWVEEYSCQNDKNVQVIHDLFNDSLVVTRKGFAIQEYKEKNREINLEYMKKMKDLKTDLTQ